MQLKFHEVRNAQGNITIASAMFNIGDHLHGVAIQLPQPAKSLPPTVKQRLLEQLQDDISEFVASNF